MSNSLFNLPFIPAFTLPGIIAPSAHLHFYQTGTTTPIVIYDSDGDPLANPVIADAFGRFPAIYISDANLVYRARLEASDATLIGDVDPVTNPSALIATLAGLAGAGLIGFSQTAAYPVDTLGRHGQVTVSVTDHPWNAKCDGVTDDSDAIQAAFDYCSGVAVNRVLRFPGKAYITKPIIVNRRVETTTGEFLIIGDGPQAGLYTDKAINMFQTTISNGTDPQSEAIKFQNFRFEVDDATRNTFVFSYDFLRMKFISCYFRKIKVVNAAIYLQDWIFLHCNFRYWAGTTFAAGDGHKQMFGCRWTNCTWEFGGNGIRGVPNGCSLFGNLFEGSRQFWWSAGTGGLSIIGNYTEGNTQIAGDPSPGAGITDYVFTDIPNVGRACGVMFAGNFMQPHDLLVACVSLGDVLGFTSIGNNCNGNLFDMHSTRFGRLLTINDYAAGNKYIGTLAGNGPYSRREVYGVGTGDYVTGVVAFPGGGRGPTVPTISTYLTIVSTCATAGNSIVLPASDDMVSPDVGTDVLGQPTRSIFREFIVTNNGATNLSVNTNQHDVSNYGLVVTLTVAPGTTRRIAQLAAGVAPVFLN